MPANELVSHIRRCEWCLKPVRVLYQFQRIKSVDSYCYLRIGFVIHFALETSYFAVNITLAKRG